MGGGGDTKNYRIQLLLANATATITAQFDTPGYDEATTFHVSCKFSPNTAPSQQRLPWGKLGKPTKPDETITQLTDCLDAKTTATQTLEDPSCLKTHHVPCEPALMELATECPLNLSLWTAWPLSKWMQNHSRQAVDKLSNHEVADETPKQTMAKRRDERPANIVDPNYEETTIAQKPSVAEDNDERNGLSEQQKSMKGKRMIQRLNEESVRQENAISRAGLASKSSLFGHIIVNESFTCNHMLPR